MSSRLLLDTHIALWAVIGSSRLGARARQAIVLAEEVYVSVASLWEIAIKHSLGKGDRPVSAAQASEAFVEAGFRMLDVQPAHAVAAEQLPWLHGDPFDRLLIAQAFTEPLVLVTRDARIAGYGGNILNLG